MKGLSQRFILSIGLVVILAVVIIGAALVQSGVEIFSQNNEPVNYAEPPPADVVRQYFAAWNDKDWPDMYATISDGFKKIDPNAKDLAAFRSYAEAQPITGVKILSIRETSNDGDRATVDYSVEFTTTNGTSPFSGTFTLRYRPGDVIQGWKLVHPYGPNIDAS
ncbi:MAG: nuclear transport factor 2 family protein [Candidatus Aenigmarchaeota archaeon]|nr:nuclear transport factor 2 family protein [Candidatus Aenigmarchaeota archaeon]